MAAASGNIPKFKESLIGGRLCKMISYNGWNGSEGTTQDFECPDGKVYPTFWGVSCVNATCDGVPPGDDEEPVDGGSVDGGMGDGY